MLQLQRFEMRGNLLRHGDGARGCQGAIIHAGAGDDIRDQPDIGCCQISGAQLLIQIRQESAGDMGQDDILLMADAQFIMAEFLRQIRHDPHLLGRCITGGGPMFFQRNRHNRIVFALMLIHISIHK